MYTLLSGLIDFFERNISSECFLFTSLTITRLLSVVLLRPRGKRWQPSISTGFIIMLEFLQISITWFSSSSSGISFEIPDISTLFLLLCCSALTCNFSRLTIPFSRLTLTFLAITNSLVIFSFAAVTWLRLSVSFSIWLQRFHFIFDYIFSICSTRSFFLILLISSQDIFNKLISFPFIFKVYKRPRREDKNQRFYINK